MKTSHTGGGGETCKVSITMQQNVNRGKGGESGVGKGSKDIY